MIKRRVFPTKIKPRRNLRTRFRSIVTSETSLDRTGAIRTMYVATSLDWYLTAQGRTVRAAITSLERILKAQTAIMCHPRYRKCAPPKPAPDDYQRVRDTGSFTCTDPQWAPYIRPSAVHLRKTICLRKS